VHHRAVVFAHASEALAPHLPVGASHSVAGSTVISWLLAWPFWRSNFETFMKIPPPANVENMRYYFEGGGLTDQTVIYCFETSPAEVDRMIREMAMTRDTTGNLPQVVPMFGDWTDAPDLSKWENPESFRISDRSTSRYLVTDGKKRRAYLAFLST
jgi:hypothetical protein